MKKIAWMFVALNFTAACEDKQLVGEKLPAPVVDVKATDTSAVEAPLPTNFKIQVGPAGHWLNPAMLALDTKSIRNVMQISNGTLGAFAETARSILGVDSRNGSDWVFSKWSNVAGAARRGQLLPTPLQACLLSLSGYMIQDEETGEVEDEDEKIVILPASKLVSGEYAFSELYRSEINGLVTVGYAPVTSEGIDLDSEVAVGFSMYPYAKLRVKALYCYGPKVTLSTLSADLGLEVTE